MSFNIIFLDIDGVLNTQDHLRRQQREKGKGNVTNRDWCPVACQHVALLCQHFEARIVISSTWRYDHGLDELRVLFSDNGITGDLVIDVTSSLIHEEDRGSYSRGDEIQRWLDENNYRSYVIIDDMPASGFLEEQAEHLIHAEQKMGFAEKELVIKAGGILSRS